MQLVPALPSAWFFMGWTHKWCFLGLCSGSAHSLVCLLLQQWELQAKKNGGTGFADSNMHMDAVAWILLGEKKLEIFSMVFSASRGAGQFFPLLEI